MTVPMWCNLAVENYNLEYNAKSNWNSPLYTSKPFSFLSSIWVNRKEKVDNLQLFGKGLRVRALGIGFLWSPEWCPCAPGIQGLCGLAWYLVPLTARVCVFPESQNLTMVLTGVTKDAFLFQSCFVKKSLHSLSWRAISFLSIDGPWNISAIFQVPQEGIFVLLFFLLHIANLNFKTSVMGWIVPPLLPSKEIC